MEESIAKCDFKDHSERVVNTVADDKCLSITPTPTFHATICPQTEPNGNHLRWLSTAVPLHFLFKGNQWNPDLQNNTPAGSVCTPTAKECPKSLIVQ